MDSDKVKTTQEWKKAPTTMTKLRFFLGWTNYHLWFIEGYSRRVAPLTVLLKKDHTWLWLACPQICQRDEAIWGRDDAYDFSLGGVLIQASSPKEVKSWRTLRGDTWSLRRKCRLLSIVLESGDNISWGCVSLWKRTTVLSIISLINQNWCQGKLDGKSP